MIKVYKKIFAIFMAFSALYVANIIADPSGSPATILVESLKMIMYDGEPFYIKFIVNNPTGQAINNIVVNVNLPAGFTVSTTTVAVGTSCPPPYTTWTFNTPLAPSASVYMTLSGTYNGPSGGVATASATFTSGSTGTSQVNILLGCPVIKWGDPDVQNSGVLINNGNVVHFNNAMAIYGPEDLAVQGVAAEFTGFRKNENPPPGHPEYTARILNWVTNLFGPVLQFTNGNYNNPYQIVNPSTGIINAAAITDDPPNYLEGKFTFDATTYPNGLNGVSFEIYSITSFQQQSPPFNGWQNSVIVFATDIHGNQVPPITELSYFTTLYKVNSTPYSLTIAGKGGVNVNYDWIQVRETYYFTQPLRSIDVRFFRNAIINLEQIIFLSNIYLGCEVDLALALAVEDMYECEQCFTFTVSAINNGPNDIPVAQVTGVVPDGLVVTAATPSKGAFDANTGVWTIGSLYLEQEETLVVTACASQDSITWHMVLTGGGQTVPGNNVVDKTIAVSYIVVNDDMAMTLENTPVFIDWAANDYAVPGTLDLTSFEIIPPFTTDGVVEIDSPGVIKFTPDIGFLGTTFIHYKVCDDSTPTPCCGQAVIKVIVEQNLIMPPQALNDSASTPLNTSVNIAVLNNDLTGSVPLDPSTVQIITAPNNGSITAINQSTGVITYHPTLGFVGNDSFVYEVCDEIGQCTQASVYITVFDPYAPCPHTSLLECHGCFNVIDECLCTPVSFGHFSAITGAWSQVGDKVTTSAGLNTFNFLKYLQPVSQTFEVLEVDIEFPSGQLLNEYVSAGLVTHWDGSNQVNQKGAYICIDNRTGVPVNPQLKIGGINSSEMAFSLPFPINLNQSYTLRLVHCEQTTYGYVDGVFIGSSNTGAVNGNLIGIWAFQATPYFRNLRSCSYRKVVHIPCTSLHI
ncbi:MAG: Ig-like domain-containing protein [Candidatus Babeliales bacterium]